MDIANRPALVHANTDHRYAAGCGLQCGFPLSRPARQDYLETRQLQFAELECRQRILTFRHPVILEAARIDRDVPKRLERAELRRLGPYDLRIRRMFNAHGELQVVAQQDLTAIDLSVDSRRRWLRRLRHSSDRNRHKNEERAHLHRKR